ncbi:hypothetical protein LOK49_LG11G00947 [Camellia lanceoleosa]|uniref:Uncharacterized protein n=1 Tax=Camellia lanceoleosa TaxID=1840588 RepID=A0ACC0G2N8_9ERIC|nr:hypothetical protein LOK49_LG11G00947 [Camellia lanceoleosa]
METHSTTHLSATVIAHIPAQTMADDGGGGFGGLLPMGSVYEGDIVQVDQLEVSSNHFPVLQRLVLIQCNGLKKIPSEMGNIPTLQMIEVHWCHPFLANSAKEIKEEQESIGNNWLQMIGSNNNVL